MHSGRELMASAIRVPNRLLHNCITYVAHFSEGDVAVGLLPRGSFLWPLYTHLGVTASDRYTDGVEPLLCGRDCAREAPSERGFIIWVRNLFALIPFVMVICGKLSGYARAKEVTSAHE